MRMPVLGCSNCASSECSLRFEIPCIGALAPPNPNRIGLCVNPDPVKMFFPGNPKSRYVTTVRVRGMMEVKNYVGGVVGTGSNGWLVFNAGTLFGDTLNSYWFTFQSTSGRQRAFINRNFGQPRPNGLNYVPVDYVSKIQIDGGSCIALHCDTIDDSEIRNFYGEPNCSQFQTLCDIRPPKEPFQFPDGNQTVFNGQWAQLDFDCTVTLPTP